MSALKDRRVSCTAVLDFLPKYHQAQIGFHQSWWAMRFLKRFLYDGTFHPTLSFFCWFLEQQPAEKNRLFVHNDKKGPEDPGASHLQWQLNLLAHIESVQKEVASRMDLIEKEVDGNEDRAETQLL